MPRIVAAMLCGTLIWIYPQILEIMLTHAEKTERYREVYFTLTGITILLTGLIGIYMWFGFKSGPSGLEHALRQFSKVFGSDSKEANENKATESKKNEIEQGLVKFGDKNS